MNELVAAYMVITSAVTETHQRLDVVRYPSIEACREGLRDLAPTILTAVPAYCTTEKPTWWRDLL